VRLPRTVRKVPSSSSSSLVFLSSWFDPLGSWVLVARALSDSPQTSHGWSAGVGRSEVNRQTVRFSWGATRGLS
jgi:hypothetical protein